MELPYILHSSTCPTHTHFPFRSFYFISDADTINVKENGGKEREIEQKRVSVPNEYHQKQKGISVIYILIDVHSLGMSSDKAYDKMKTSERHTYRFVYVRNSQ